MTSRLSDNKGNLLIVLTRLEGGLSSGAGDKIDETWEEFFQIIASLEREILPYSAVSQFVYSNDNVDLEYFIENIHGRVEDNYNKDEKDQDYIKAKKLLEHLDLAYQQKTFLFLKQEATIGQISSDIQVLEKVSSEVTKVKEEVTEVKEEVTEAKEEVKATKKEFNKIEKAINQITSNLISILGIFAAILIGAFGAIQAFSSLFSNAHLLSFGKLIVLSAIGAASVILILFFLLNGIAKLTERKLWSANEGSPLVKKYPILFLAYSGIVFTALIGAALELSNIEINFALQGFWWLLPIIWGIGCYRYFKSLFK